ncbi:MULTISPECIES: MerR family transcriptional regulator [Parachlamydia]|uniref:MerR family transcriptional regulator n=1 Tax=Parachlamydia TaxID=83551 RepID=UPI0001C17C6C|nr:MerR family transcriptional regulator [Parachlamydia acanthamoebae]EFB42328.1 hypothetical protein pah_c010o017 [Parachlamydia acanthamoebae str. Hall's coccus]
MSSLSKNTESQNEKNSSSEFFINLFCRGSIFKNRLEMYHSTEICKEVSACFHYKEQHVKNLPMTYRTINHWESLGLINSGRKEDKHWRQFSILDQVWLYTIEALRDFGLPLDKIKNAKSIFFTPFEQYPFPLMEYYISCAYILLEHVYLIVFSDGFTIPLTYTEYKDALKNNWIKSHLQIDMNEIIQKIFPDQNLLPKYKNEALITPQEFEVFYMVRTGKFEEIKIKLKKGSIHLVEGTEHLDKEEKIQDILREGLYQDIQIKQENGKMVSFKRTVRNLIE